MDMVHERKVPSNIMITVGQNSSQGVRNLPKAPALP